MKLSTSAFLLTSHLYHTVLETVKFCNSHSSIVVPTSTPIAVTLESSGCGILYLLPSSCPPSLSSFQSAIMAAPIRHPAYIARF